MNIQAEIEALCAAADKRMQACQAANPYSVHMTFTALDFMSEAEKTRLYVLKSQLPSFAEQQAQARVRVKERLAAIRNRQGLPAHLAA